MIEDHPPLTIGASPCAHVRPDGTRCRAPALHGDDRCWFHTEDPAVVAKREAGRRQGGKGRVVKPNSAWTLLQLEARADLKEAGAAIFNAVMSGTLHPSVANAGVAALSLVRGVMNDQDALNDNTGRPYTKTDLEEERRGAHALMRALLFELIEQHPELRQELVTMLERTEA